jgi:hypothetical protein
VTPELRQMIEYAAGFAEERFKERGTVLPMWHAVAGNGEHMIVPAPDGVSKDESCLLIRALFELREVTRYVFIDEGWMLNKRRDELAPGELERIQRNGIRNHPDARGVVFITAEDATGCSLARREVIGRRKLGPLVFEPFDGAEGRMVGMLPKPRGAMTQ